jgi:hypothetical protein
MSQDYNGIQNGNARDDIREAITQLGLSFRLMTQFTSFVAVEEMTVTDGGEPRKIEVPVEMPEGVSQESVFGHGNQPFEKLQLLADLQRAPLARKAPSGGGGGGGSRTTGVAASRGELPKVSLKDRATKDSRSGSPGGVGSGSASGMGSGSGPAAAPKAVFTPNNGLTLAESLGMANKADRISPAEQKQREFFSKMNPSITAVIERLKNKPRSRPPMKTSSYATAKLRFRSGSLTSLRRSSLNSSNLASKWCWSLRQRR